MRPVRSLSFLLVLVSLIAGNTLGCRTPAGDTVSQQRASVRQMRDEALQTLYADKPGSKALVDRSVGYAVFTNIGTNLLLLSTARGYGVLRDKSSGADTYMKMLSLGGGVGLGVKDVRVYFVFLDRDAMNDFKENGLDLSGQADATATAEDAEGIEMNATENLDSVQAKVMVFQITEQGLAAQATLQGTKYSIDEELN